MKKLSIALVAVLAVAACKKTDPDAIAQISDEQKAQIEKCCEEISTKAYVDREGAMVIVANGKEIATLSQEDALKISPAWDYKNLKAYASDGDVHNFELDACDVLVKLNAFIDNAANNPAVAQ